jgi:hypothetical protein
MAFRGLRALRDSSSDSQQAARLKVIADQLQGTYEALRQAAANISGLLQGGQATCDEVKAYNLWALAIWNTQRGMVEALRAGGQTDVADVPLPTTFVWQGASGEDAINIDCGSQEQALNGLGLMRAALRGPGPTTRFLSLNDVRIATTDPHVFDPTSAPSFKTLVALQQQAQQQAGLGFVQVIIAIAVIVVAVVAGLAAIMHYLEVNEVQEANTEQTRLQAQAFANFTQARLSCMTECTNTGKSQDECVEQCKALIQKPDIKVPGIDSPWGTLQWIGFTVVVGAGLWIAYKLYERHRSGKPLFELPESVHDAMNPP